MANQSNCWRSSARRMFFAAGLLAFGPIGTAYGQEGGGVTLTFGIDQRLEHTTNPGLGIPAAAAEFTSRTRLNFGFVTETRTQRFSVSGEGTLAAGNSRDKGFILPSAKLDYRIESAASSFEFGAFVRETEVDSESFTTMTSGGLPLVTSVIGRGTQQRRGGTARLEFGREAPFGGDISVALTDTSYSGTTDPQLVDSRRLTSGLSLRFNFSEVTTATAKFTASRLEEVGAAAKQTETIALGIEHTLSNGAFTVDASFAKLQTGQRGSLSFGRSFDLPAGSLAASVGVSEIASSGRTAAIGSLNWTHELPRGKLSVALSRGIEGDARDAETERSSLTLGLTQELTPRAGLTVTFGFQDSRETLTNISTQNASLSTSIRYALTEDWGMDIGASLRLRNKDGFGRSKSNKVYFAINRAFEFRP